MLEYSGSKKTIISCYLANHIPSFYSDDFHDGHYNDTDTSDQALVSVDNSDEEPDQTVSYAGIIVGIFFALFIVMLVIAFFGYRYQIVTRYNHVLPDIDYLLPDVTRYCFYAGSTGGRTRAARTGRG